MTILFIIESAGKLKKISSILGKGYIIKASMGHIRDVPVGLDSIDFDNNFKPTYVITNPKSVKNLKSAMKGIEMVYIATDDDLEGYAIAQGLIEILKPKAYKRVLFNAITKKAIMDGIKNAGPNDQNMVNAQKARRILDMIVGCTLSPLLQRKIGAPSAGRVQSPALELIVEREKEIINFLEKNKDSTFFKVSGTFSGLKSTLWQSSDKNPWKLDAAYKGSSAQVPLSDGSKPNGEIIAFMKKCLKSNFTIHDITSKNTTRSPAPPFETATLQQEAHRKFGMKVDVTMKIAQKLYEGGYITYMRTDSVTISDEGHAAIKDVILQEYGKEYYQKNIYKNKSDSTQGAHECIRPTHPELLTVEEEVDDPQQIKLYKLIWQRTIASQMKPAKIKVETIQIDIGKYLEEKLTPYYYFQSQVEEVEFPGFMKVYVESKDDAEEEDPTAKAKQLALFKKLKLKTGNTVIMEEVKAKQEYLRPQPRYTEASLVKKLKSLGIGRPGTYVATIKRIQDRKYVEVGDSPGIKKEIKTYTIKSSKGKPIMEVKEDDSTILIGKESKKLMPTKMGITVCDYLLENFPELMDYKFTANLEAEMDSIAKGEKIWHKVVKKFYDKFNPIVINLSKIGGTISKLNEKSIGQDSDGNEIFVTKTKHGPVVIKKIGEKRIYASIEKPLTLEKIKLKDALKLLVEREAQLEYPKVLGKYQKKDVELYKGKFGFYVKFDGENYSLNPDIKKDISLEEAIKEISEKKSNRLAEFEIVENKKKIKAIVLNGKFGPYVTVLRGKKRSNYPLAKNVDPKKLTSDQVASIISQKRTYGGSKTGKKTPSTKKKPAPKKASSK